jgi:phage repressor protein C with HTH and peptisase S24 domain
MKRIGMISTAVLSLALGVAAPAYAQQDQRDQQDEQKAKSGQQEEKKAQPEKSARQEEKPAAHQEKTAKPEEKNAQQQDKSTKNEEKNVQQQQQHMQQAQSGKQEQRAGGNGGGRIPDDRFKANFGQQHRFRVSQADYSRDRRFQYGGYWFGFVDPWPSNWLYTQDVFVVEINGVYYLCNSMYPGVNILLSVTL